MENITWTVIVVIMMVITGAVTYMVVSGDTDIPGITEADVQNAVNSAVSQAVAQKDAIITDLQTKIDGLMNGTISSETGETKTEEEKEAEEQDSIIGYLLDELFLEKPRSEILSDREINLFDGEIEFNDKNYDAEETFELSGLEVRANDNDFEGKPYLVVKEEGIIYQLIFEPDLNTGNISNDETLKFNFLGESVEVSEWSGDSITFTKGKEYFMDQGDIVTVNNKTITLEVVMEDSVYVKVGDEGKKIKVDNSATVGGIEIKVNEVIYSGYAGGHEKAELVIGIDIDQEIDNMDEYEEDSIWEWIISDHSIGLILKEDFNELDEDHSALDVDEKICLPNDYICLKYNGFIDEDTETYRFEEDNGFVEVKGDFQAGTEDYNKIYIFDNSTVFGIFDDDEDDAKYIGTSIKLGDSDTNLEVNITGLIIKDIIIPLDLNSIIVGSDNISTNDEDYLTDYGILIDNPEDTIESEELRLTIPEEKREATISIL